MPNRPGFHAASIVAIGLASLSACEPKTETNASNESSGTESTESGSEDSGDPLPECAPPGPVTDQVFVRVEFPGRDDVDREGHQSEREATCMLVDASGQAMRLELELVCDELGGALQQPYTITFESLQVPPAALFSLDSPIELSYRWWHSFEVGGGSRLSLAQGGEVRLLGYSESSGDGQPSICATPDASLRTRAEQWLAPIDARVESAACEDPGMLRLARTTESGEAHVHPGEIVEFDDGVTAVLGQARCDVEHGEHELWTLEIVAWR